MLTPPEVTAAAGALAFVGAMLALRQKAANDRHEAWWNRAQWAIDLSLSDQPARQQLGTATMSLLAQVRSAAQEDLDVLDLAASRVAAQDDDVEIVSKPQEET